MTATGIDVGGRYIVLEELHVDLENGGVPVPYGLTVSGPPPQGIPPFPPDMPYPAGTLLFTYDAQGNPADLPPEAGPIVEAYSPSASKPA